jgi:hypothetical protein
MCLVPLALNAEESTVSPQIAGVVKNIAEGVENGQGEKAVRTEIQNYTLGVANGAADRFEQNILANTNLPISN